MRYPNGIKQNKTISYSNRGMTLEKDINETNSFYLISNIAIIHKKPTPITITKVDYPCRKEAIIKEAYFKTPSTTDYNGLYKGKYLDFEAKETKTDIFPLRNIHEHQLCHLKKIVEHGGIGFLIVRFTNNNKTFLLQAEKIFSFIQSNNRKSIPFCYFEKEGFLIKDKFNPRIDYLKIIDILYFEGEVL